MTVLPDPVKFATAKVGAESSTKVTVSVPGGKPFRITSIDGLGDGLTIAEALPTGPRPVHILNLKYMPAAAGPFQRKLTIRTDVDKTTVATVTIDGTAN